MSEVKGVKERKTRRVQLALRPSFYREIELFGLVYGKSVTDVIESSVVMYLNAERRRNRRVAEGGEKNV
jgi:hypothetical protein